MTHSLPLVSTRRLLLAATMVAWVGTATGFAQGLPTYGAPTMGSSSTQTQAAAPAALATSPLGGIQFGLGSLGGVGALGSITTCPVNDIGGASTAMATAPSGLSPLVTSPLVTPQMVAPSVTVPQYVITPIILGPQVVNPLTATPQVVSPSVRTSIATSPVTALLGTTPALTSPFGTSTVTGACSPVTLGAATAAAPSSVPTTGASFSDAALPLDATETGSGGLSPTVDVPPPALYSSGVTPPGQ